MTVWRLGDDIDTDVIAPGKYMKLGVEEIAKHCLESVVPSFAKEARPGDVLVAESFAGLFYRNALNLGLPALVCPQANRINDGEDLKIDYDASRIVTAS